MCVSVIICFNNRICSPSTIRENLLDLCVMPHGRCRSVTSSQLRCTTCKSESQVTRCVKTARVDGTRAHRTRDRR